MPDLVAAGFKSSQTDLSNSIRLHLRLHLRLQLCVYIISLVSP